MTTSAITSWPLTAEEVVTQACYELGSHAAGETPSGQEMNDAIVRLNAMLKSWQGEGNLFREATTAYNFGAAEAAGAVLDADIRAINNVWAVGSYNRLLTEWNRSEYLSVANPATLGTPTAWYAETRTSGLVLHLYPAPSTDTPLLIDYSRKACTVTDPSETVDLPEEWQEALTLGLASRLASLFGATRFDPNNIARIDQRAIILYQRLLDRDRPDSYYFEPDV